MLDPIGGFERIRDFYITYLDTAFRIRDEGISAERRELLKRPGTLCTEPLIEPLPSFETAYEIHDLAHDRPSDPRLPGFSPEERRAFVDLALAGLLDSKPAPDGSPTLRLAEYALYRHQAQMLERGVQEGKAGIVTSGTGSGKTEAFLLPVFAKLAQEALRWDRPAEGYLARRWWQDPSGQPYPSWKDVPDRPDNRHPDASPFRLQREGERRPAAVRALILYPMNALVEDQLVRIRRALDSDDARATMDRHFNGNRIFFARYTSDTKVTGFHRHPRPDSDEPRRRARKLEELFHASVAMQRTQHLARQIDQERRDGDEEQIRFLFSSVDGGELTSRWDIQETPPDILITNITMLSAILAREVDAPILDKTRDWIMGNDDAYFFLILDELHLHRGSAGTEVSFLLRLFLDRIGLTDPAHCHKLRILASSASLPMEGPEREASLAYLWDMFGRHGTRSRTSWAGASGPDDWADAVITGTTIDHVPSSDHRLDPAPFIELLRESGSSDNQVAKLDHPRQHEDLWRRIDSALNPTASGTVALHEAVRRCIVEAGARLAHACWSEIDRRPRATRISTLAERLFGGADEDSMRAVRGLVLVRGAGEHWREWWPDTEAPQTVSFRVHTFFRSIDGLFAAAGDRARNAVDPRFRVPTRLIGPLSIDRGLRFERAEDGEVGDRIIELAYCEACGELFFGGRRGERTDMGEIELLPAEPDLENLPDTSLDDLFENLSAEEFALFWPSNDRFWPHTDCDPEPAHEAEVWRRAYFDPRSGRVHPVGVRGPELAGSIPGYLYHRVPRRPDKHGRSSSDPGTAVPYACPACGMDYSARKGEFRLSPIRNFRTGFAKTTQLLATELFALLKREQSEPKLVSFSDSRQDAAKAALDIESRHHEDLRREILVRKLREVADARPNENTLRARLAKVDEEFNQCAAAGEWDRAIELKQEKDRIKQQLESTGHDEIPLREILETTDDAVQFLGPAGRREPLKPLLAEFVRLGVHPTDPAGTALIDGGEEYTFRWYELFTVNGDQVDWRDDDVLQNELNTARQELVRRLKPRICEIIFSKTYFSLEETGVGYPCVPTRCTRDDEERALLDAFLRVFADAYQLKDDPWADRGRNAGRSEWNSARDIGMKSRVRRFAEAIWPSDRVDSELDRVLEALARAGHKKGLIFTDALCIRLVDGDAPYWRCSICGRVHLHHGVGRCTRCFAALPKEPTGRARELRERNFLAKRIERPDHSFRLRCEELTGQTDDPADRQRRFKGIVLHAEEGSLAANEDLLYRSHVVDLLAVTTTMEVGIDIGPLQAVFEANMPPQRFNYQQRVGRAGRRKQAYSFVLTVCRSRSHDLYYFWNPEAITGDAPPPPFLTKKQSTAALRFVRKAWLWKAFDNIRAEYGVGYPGDGDPDIHGEFVPLSVFFAEDGKWIHRLEWELTETRAYKDHIVSVLTADSPLEGAQDFQEFDVGRLMGELETLRYSRNREYGLAQAMAEAGYLPMYGMPTRVRSLYTRHTRARDGRDAWTWETIDRDLDLAIFEFAPGSVLVKDKEQHLCVGFTGPLPDFYPRNRVIEPLGAAFNDAFWLAQCRACGAWQRFEKNPSGQERVCQSCGSPLPGESASICQTPNGFRTDFQPRSIHEEALTSRWHRSIVAEGEPIPFVEDPSSNLQFASVSRSRTYRLNRGHYDSSSGNWLGFNVMKGSQSIHTRVQRSKVLSWRLREQFIEQNHRIGRFDPESSDLDPSRFWLAAEKTTDSLFLAPKVIPPGLRARPVNGEEVVTSVRAAAISAAHILVQRAALELDVDPEEFDIVEPRIYRPAGGPAVPVLQFTDHLINGAGFCERLASTDAHGTPWIAEIIHSILDERNEFPLREFLRDDSEVDHPAECDQACYRCLHRYSNRMYHGLLDWRLGLAFLELLRNPAFSCGLDGHFTRPALEDWPRLARSYAEDMIRFSDGGEIREVSGLYAFRFDRRKHLWALIVHPLWDCSARPGVVGEALDDLVRLGARENDIQFVDTFELARRQVKAREHLLRVWRARIQ